jgi:2-octaprenyl-6-methoxyphenol hydroxylase
MRRARTTSPVAAEQAASFSAASAGPLWSIMIAGGGVAGLSVALALKQALGAAAAVTVADPGFAAPVRPSGRAYAIAAAGRQMFGALRVWDAIAATAEPIRNMVVTDSRTRDVVRPVFLTFGDGGTEGREPFAHMVEDETVMAVLRQACAQAGVVLLGQKVTGFRVDEPGIEVTLSDGATQRLTLLVAADGARSALREQAGIGWTGWSYPQSGLVATIAHERNHEGRAIEHFLPSGPFAILPLRAGGRLGHRSSIVWTERSADVQALLALDGEDMLAEIESRFGLELGEIALETGVKAYPLAFGIARQFVAPRLALLGDAAHAIHPIAGQGLNLGLKDAAALAQAIVDAARLGLDPGTADVLAQYQQARRLDTVAMGAVTDGLNRLFSNDSTPLRLARDLGLGLVDRMPSLKRFFIGQAADAEDGPRLLRGEAL